MQYRNSRKSSGRGSRSSSGRSSRSGGPYRSGGYRSSGPNRFGGQRRFGPRKMYKITCSKCGKEAEVPFKPRAGTPVYCKECFLKKKGIRPREELKEEGEEESEEEQEDTEFDEEAKD